MKKSSVTGKDQTLQVLAENYAQRTAKKMHSPGWKKITRKKQKLEKLLGQEKRYRDSRENDPRERKKSAPKVEIKTLQGHEEKTTPETATASRQLKKCPKVRNKHTHSKSREASGIRSSRKSKDNLSIPREGRKTLSLEQREKKLQGWKKIFLMQ
jgi:hypothetical protein